MIVIGSEFVDFTRIKIFEFNLQNCKQKPDFIYINDQIQAVLANANQIKFLVCKSMDLAKQIQNLAEDYLFDSKIAVLADTNSDFQIAINHRIDAIIFQNAII